MALGSDDEFEVGGKAEEGSKPKKDFFFDEDEPNLVATFKAHPEGQEALEELGRQAVSDFDTAWESTEEYRQRCADDYKIILGNLPKKTGTFQHAANVHVPIALENLTRITFRAFSELFDDWSQPFSVLPVGPDDQQVADILTRHDNWQLCHQIKDFYRQQMRAMMVFFSNGDVTGHSYYDEQRRTNVHEVLTCDEFVIPYVNVSMMPDYSDVPYRIKKLERYRHQIQQMKGIWDDEEIEKVLEREKTDLDDEPETLWADAAAEIRGIEKPTDQRTAPYKLLQWEGWTDELPNQDRDRFVQVIVDYYTKRVLSLMIYEEPNWQEKLRHEQQQKEHAAYSDAVMQHKQQLEQLPQMQAQLESQASQMLASGQAMPPEQYEQQRMALDPANHPHPPPPTWMMDPEAEDQTAFPDPEDPKTQPKEPHKEPISMFVHGVCVEPIQGNLGYGFGRMQSDFNKAGNTLFSQFIDSATLANVWGLITAGNVEFERPLSFAPGAVNVAKGVTGAQLKDSIQEMKAGPANPQMIEALNMIIGWGQSSAQAPEVLSGEPGKSGETFRGINTRVEQATKQLSVPTRSYAKTFLGPTLLNNALLNSKFMPEEELRQINNELGQPIQVMMKRSMYERNYQIMIGSDLRFASRGTRIDEADQTAQMAAQTGPFPILASNTAFQHAALVKSLKARGCGDLVPLLGQAPPAPQFYGDPPPPTPAQIQAQQQAAAQQQQQQAAQQQQGAPPGAQPPQPPQPG